MKIELDIAISEQDAAAILHDLEDRAKGRPHHYGKPATTHPASEAQIRAWAADLIRDHIAGARFRRDNYNQAFESMERAREEKRGQQQRRRMVTTKEES
jgi:hypothetical protein